jgi:hypothetical protein
MSKTPIDAKALREKIEGLYKGKDLTQDDRKILIREKKTIVNQEREKDPEFREKRARNNADPKVRAKRQASMPDQTGKNNPFYNKSHTSETKTIISKKKKGCKAPNKGSTHTEEALSKMRKPRSEEGKVNMRKPRTKVLTCSHCGKTGASGNMARYHMENCKVNI